MEMPLLFQPEEARGLLARHNFVASGKNRQARVGEYFPGRVAPACAARAISA